MSTYHHIQRDFSGGEISPRMLMRQDTEVYKKSVLEMTNYMPMLQGGMQRTPGTRYVLNIPQTEARIIPYLTQANERSLVVMTANAVKMYININDFVDGEITEADLSGGGGTIIYKKQIVENSQFETKDGWLFSPEGPIGAKGYPQTLLGGWFDTQSEIATINARSYRGRPNEIDVVTAEHTCEVDVATDVATVSWAFTHAINDRLDGGYTLDVVISDQPDYSNALFTKQYTEEEFPEGTDIVLEPANFSLPTPAWTGTLYMKITNTAIRRPKPDDASTLERGSTVNMNLREFKIYTNGESELTEVDLTTPYLRSELKDLHYVQSPYNDKELVITHPRHAPHRLKFDTGGGAYVFEPIPFTNPPAAWGVNDYPASCSAYHGRLVLGGSQSFRVVTGDPVASVAETVWCTEVGEWDTFSDPNDVEVNPDDSIEFTAIYRSPIQWVYGHKALLVGALEYEYVASGEGIFSPGDLGVFLQSTHGSINVQPAAFGESVLFPADGGKRCRTMSYSNQDDGWVSEDLNLLHPDILKSGIKRMVRVRTPHQMCFVLTNDGNVAIYHSEAAIRGWSRYDIGGKILDLCVLANDEGEDVPYFIVRRQVDGVYTIYIEALANFNNPNVWEYLECTKAYDLDTPSSVLTGLDHLEGRAVQVYERGRFIDGYTVSGGSITLDNDYGGQYTVVRPIVGLKLRNKIRTLPPEKQDPGAQARYSEFSLRTLGSTRPVINGQRPSDRDPETQLNKSQTLDLYNDIDITTSQWNPYQIIQIEEPYPFACTVIGVYGRLTSNSL